MRVAIDIQAVQLAGKQNTEPHLLSLLEALVPRAREITFDLYSNKHLPRVAAEAAAGTLPHPQAVDYGAFESVAVKELLLKTVLLRDRPDALFLLPSRFPSANVDDGEMANGEGAAVTPSFGDFPLRTYAVCFDLAPLVFPDQFYDATARPNAAAAAQYQKWLQNLRHADFVFVASEALRRDAIALLKISPDKIATVSAGISPFFAPLSPTEQAEWQSVLARKWNVTLPFVLSCGPQSGEEWRVNGEGVVDAFARLPESLRTRHQLVIVGRCVKSETDKRLKRRAWQQGLAAGDFIVVEAASDEEWRALCGLCRSFVYPSLYEGFGFPVVEAMACGAATIVGNHPALAELVPSAGQQFNARSAASIAARLESLLSDAAQLARLRESGPQEAARFTWQAAAQKINAVLERDAASAISTSAFASLNPDTAEFDADSPLPPVKETFAFRRAAPPVPGAKPVVAFWSPLRPLQSGISDYSEEILLALAHHYDLDLVIDDGYKPIVDTGTRHRIVGHRQFAKTVEEERRDYHALIYQMGNSAFHIYEYAALLRYAGIAVLHDYNMNGMVNFMETLRPEWGITHYGELAYHYGKEKAREVVRDLASKKYDIADLPAHDVFTNRRIFTRSLGVVVHSSWAYQKALHEHADVCSHLALIPHLMPPVSCKDTPDDILRLRQKWGVPSDAFVFASCGFIAQTKRPLQILDAFRTHLATHPNAFLLFVGGVFLPGDFAEEIARRGLKNRVKVSGYVDDLTDFYEYVRLSDVGIALRYPSNGESSGALLRILAHGKPCIVTAIGSFNDFPDTTVHKLAPPRRGIRRKSPPSGKHCINCKATARTGRH